MSVVLLVASAASLVIAWAAACVMLPLGYHSRFLGRIGLGSATALRAAFVLAPALVGLLALLVILVPSPFSHCHCLEHGGHHPHLCVRHPWLALPLLAPAAGLSAAWLAQAGWRAWGVLRDLVASERWVRCLAELPSETVAGVAVRLVDDLALGAFTLGIWTPVVAVDRALWEGLTSEERLAVVHHESAHLQRRDAVTLAGLRLVSTLLPWPANGPWLKGWRAATEAACDRYSANQVGDATCVAMALVSVERLRARLRGLAPLSPALGIAAGTDLQVRVHALLEDKRGSAPLANDLLAVGIALVGLALLLILVPGSSLHHFVESLLGLLVH